MIITLAILALLASMAAPLTETVIRRGRADLRHALYQLRTIDAYKRASDADSSKSRPAAVAIGPSEVLVDGVRDCAARRARVSISAAHSRSLADTRLSAEETWGLRSYSSNAEDPRSGDVFDVCSRARGQGLNGITTGSGDDEQQTWRRFYPDQTDGGHGGDRDLTIAMPRYFSSLENSRTPRWRRVVGHARGADQYYGDRVFDSLERLVAERYLRSLPVDPIIERSDQWQVLPPEEAGAVADVRSGAVPGRGWESLWKLVAAGQGRRALPIWGCCFWWP